MQHQIGFGPAFSLLVVNLEAGEEIRCEPGAMVSMRGDLEIAGRMNAGENRNAGFFKKAFRAAKAVVGGESFFITTIRAGKGPGEVTLAPAILGDIVSIPLDGREALVVQQGGYLASAPGVEVDGSWGGFKSLLGGEGLFLLRATGIGALFVCSFGAIFSRELKAGQRMVVDSGHMVAYTDGMGVETRMAAERTGGGFFRRATTSVLTGEGLVFEFTGPGTVWIQTRNPNEFVGWLHPLLPQPTASGTSAALGAGLLGGSLGGGLFDSGDSGGDGDSGE